jgi:hypothetical protein
MSLIFLSQLPVLPWPLLPVLPQLALPPIAFPLTVAHHQRAMSPIFFLLPSHLATPLMVIPLLAALLPLILLLVVFLMAPLPEFCACKLVPPTAAAVL